LLEVFDVDSKTRQMRGGFERHTLTCDSVFTSHNKVESHNS
jgi:hypothetical protein